MKGRGEGPLTSHSTLVPLKGTSCSWREEFFAASTDGQVRCTAVMAAMSRYPGVAGTEQATAACGGRDKASATTFSTPEMWRTSLLNSAI